MLHNNQTSTQHKSDFTKHSFDPSDEGDNDDLKPYLVYERFNSLKAVCDKSITS